MSHTKTQSAFTIVELLVVIVIIGILAAITIVSYVNIVNKANIAMLQSDLTNASKKLNIYYNIYGAYPATMPDYGAGNYCSSNPTTDSNYCIRASNGNTFSYSIDSIYGFNLFAAKDTNIYSITKDTSPVPWITIGSQVWASTNLNFGTMITGVTSQSNNGAIEKYCYNNNESKCTNYGALYQWDEAMNYSTATTEGAKGICPAGSHIPSDVDWKALEMQLGMSRDQLDISDVSRGTDQGTQLKAGGSSGMNVLFVGYRNTDGAFGASNSDVYLWSSSESSTNAWYRNLSASQTGIFRNYRPKGYGFSIRCLKN